MNNRDFTLNAYSQLLDAIIAAGYEFQTCKDYFHGPKARVVMLRHDVDSWPINAKHMAGIEAQNCIPATYYFRKSRLSFDEAILKSIVNMGHEIGYHYEDLAACNGDFAQAISKFESNLRFYRQFYPVETIAMHGRPLSKWDSKDLWNKYDYHAFDLIGEPYLDIDFVKVMYLTDTGNCWDGDKYSIRDHVDSPHKFNIHTTDDLISHVKKGLIPNQIMLNIHPARWNENLIKWWVRDFILSKPKYLAKKWLKQRRINEKS